MSADGFVDSIKEERDRYVDLLSRLENGTEVLGKRPHGAREWIDTTADEITRSKRIIAELDALIAEHSDF